MYSRKISLMAGIIFISLLSLNLSAQTFSLTGTIRDQSTNSRLPFTNIVVEGQMIGASSDDEGRYELALESGDYEIQFSFIGYKTESVPVTIQDRNLVLNVSLIPTGVLLQEVTVYSNSASRTEEVQVSNISLQSEQIREISSVIPDVMRSIQALPGIAVNNEFSAKFNVRGGNYDENLVLVNGAQVYEPFHIKEADNASVGIFNVNLMRKVDLITGGFSARYGDRASSVLNIEYREGNRERYTGAATLSMTNLDAYIEGPLTDKGSFILGARKSYLEYILSLLDVEKNAHPSFYDLQGVMTYYLTPRDKLQFEFIHAGDNFKLDPEIQNGGPFNSSGEFQGEPADFIESWRDFQDENARYFSSLFDIQSTNFLSKKAFLRSEISYYDQLEKEGSNDIYQRRVDIYGSRDYFYNVFVDNIRENNLRIKTLELKSDLDFQYNPFHNLRAGISYQNIRYNQDLVDLVTREERFNFQNYPDTTVIRAVESGIDAADETIDAHSYKLAGYAEDIWQVNDRLLLSIGGRIDYFDFNKDLNISPRLSGSYRDLLGWTVRAAWGFFYQSPIYRQIAYPAASDTNTQAIRATHYILGVERVLPLNPISSKTLKLRIEGYYKNYNDLIHSVRTSNDLIIYSRRNDATGFAKGIDVSAVLNLPDFYGWLSYGLLSTKEDLINDSEGAFPRYTDQRHTLSLVGDVGLGKQWSFNARFFYGSGFAYTPFIAQFNQQDNRWEWVQGETNSGYLPPYRRVDTRLSKEFRMGRIGMLAFLEVSNLFNFKNVHSYRYRFNSNGEPVREEVELWPVVPSLGVTLKF